MDQSDAPLLNALADYRDKNRYGFAPPGHRQGRGTDDRVLAVLGREPFLDDVLASGGLDDRRTSNGYLQRAEDLTAEAVGAEIAWFSTCGSSLSVRAAMMAVAGGRGSLLVGRDSHKSIVAGLIFSGVQPRWITPAGTPSATFLIRPRRSRSKRPGTSIPMPPVRWSSAPARTAPAPTSPASPRCVIGGASR